MLAAGYPLGARRRNAPADCVNERGLQCRPFEERLKGFEPSTFCMASRTWGRNLVTNCLQSGSFWRARAVTVAREFTPIYDGLGTEWGPGRETGVDSARPLTCAARHAPAPVFGRSSRSSGDEDAKRIGRFKPH